MRRRLFLGAFPAQSFYLLIISFLAIHSYSQTSNLPSSFARGFTQSPDRKTTVEFNSVNLVVAIFAIGLVPEKRTSSWKVIS